MLEASDLCNPWLSSSTSNVRKAHQEFHQSVLRRVVECDHWTQALAICPDIEHLTKAYLADSKGSSSWSPESTTFLRSIAGGGTPDELATNLVMFLVRALSGHYTITFPIQMSSLNLLCGYPAAILAGKQIYRRGDQLQFEKQSNVTFSIENKCTYPCRYSGNADDLVQMSSLSPKIKDTKFLYSHELHNVFIGAKGILGEAWGWVSSGLSGVYVADHNPFSFRTGSWERRPGMVFMSYLKDEVRVAEALLHESCHQHFYFGNLDGSLEENDGIERWSEPVQQTRPVWKILLAYHAFANVCIFYEKAGCDATQNKSFLRNLHYAVRLEEALDEVCFTKLPARRLYECLRSNLDQEIPRNERVSILKNMATEI